MYGGDSEVVLLHLHGEPLDLPAGVAVDDGLCDGQSLVQITQCVELPLFAINGDVELLDTFKGELILLDQDADRIAHELLSDFEHIERHGGGEDGALNHLWHVFEDVIDLFLETTRKHFIGLIKDEELDKVWLEGAAVDHVVDTAWGTDDDVDAFLQGADIFADGGTTYATVDFDVHEVTESGNNRDDLAGQLTSWGEDEGLAVLDVCVDGLENADSEGGGLTSTCK